MEDSRTVTAAQHATRVSDVKDGSADVVAHAPAASGGAVNTASHVPASSARSKRPRVRNRATAVRNLHFGNA